MSPIHGGRRARHTSGEKTRFVDPDPAQARASKLADIERCIAEAKDAYQQSGDFKHVTEHRRAVQELRKLEHE
jgi:hypothetical protein